MPKNLRVERERFDEAVEIIRRRFPRLRLEFKHDPQVDALVDIPRQPGLDFGVNINLQNYDELHISAGALWVEWFPCGEQEVFDRFIEAVTGILLGTFRIIEHRVMGSPGKAELQRPANGGWQTIAVWSNL